MTKEKVKKELAKAKNLLNNLSIACTDKEWEHAKGKVLILELAVRRPSLK